MPDLRFFYKNPGFSHLTNVKTSIKSDIYTQNNNLTFLTGYGTLLL